MEQISITMSADDWSIFMLFVNARFDKNECKIMRDKIQEGIKDHLNPFWTRELIEAGIKG